MVTKSVIWGLTTDGSMEYSQTHNWHVGQTVVVLFSVHTRLLTYLFN
jgi:hypothetical protein